MKATGIVRRMDDLGRVVVPKELRRTMKISEGTPLEIFIDKDGSIIFRKYSPVGELNESAKNMAECISAASGIGTAVCDRDRIIATAGIPKKDLLDKPVSKQLDELMRRKKAFISMPLFTSKQVPDASLCISVKLCNVYNSPHFSNTTHTETLKTREI